MKRAIIAVLTAVFVIQITCRLSDMVSDSNAVKWNGKRETNTIQREVKNIAIPGITQMVFTAGKTSQKVNIYNPEINDCDMIFTLNIDGKTIWKSQICQPGYGFYDIELSEKLNTGVYLGTLFYECFRDEKALNSAAINVEIIVQ